MKRGVRPSVLPEDWVAEILQQMRRSYSLDFSIDDISARLKITKGSFYNYFPSKKAAIDLAINRWVEEENEVLQRNSDSPPESLRELVLCFFGAVRGYPSPVIFFLVTLSKENRSCLKLAQKIQEDRFEQSLPLLKKFGVEEESLQETALSILTTLIGMCYLDHAQLFEFSKLSIDQDLRWKLVAENCAQGVEALVVRQKEKVRLRKGH